ncbi:glycosyltransferase [Alkalilimnicola sp. S0819]|uniref:glycosyltransferase n=1 Tax=Alkalilimnicola sp. S0819 TaxID=2613922 RepID=UPI001261C0E7|nr:glycosyltransferase [Alkalilimnicola sp. S0819]KAB7628234.1 glycosyltransferase [Alkalilimnicola sp. S0819]MPQ15125.1 glycosyltransferase [Alkalilimnicola sp. S0819]
MRGNKAAFFTVVYPGMGAFLPDFLASLGRQSYRRFDLVVFDDGLPDAEEILSAAPPGLAITLKPASGTPAEIREAGIRYLLAQGYQAAIFGDSDDYFSPERVEASLDGLGTSDVVVNELTLVDEQGEDELARHYLSRRLVDGQQIDRRFIEDKNLFGLSNTAVALRRLAGLSVPNEVVAADWYIYYWLLFHGAAARYTAGAVTYYRQHGSNIASLAGDSPGDYAHGVRVKHLHYRHVARFDETMAAFDHSFDELHNRLPGNPDYLAERHHRAKVSKGRDPLWWEWIR